MNKKTVVIISIALVLALLTIAAIATFPSYIFEEPKKPTGSGIQSGMINPTDDTTSKLPEEQGFIEGHLSDDEEDGVEALLPGIDDVENDLPSTPEEDIEKGLIKVAKTDSAVLLAQKNAYASDAKVNLKKLGIFNKEYYLAHHCTKTFAKQFKAYKYSVKHDGKEIDSFTSAKLVIDVPENYDINNIAVAYLFDGYVQILDSTINQGKKTISVAASKTGVYILLEYKPEEEIELPEDDTSSDNSSNDLSSTPSDNSSIPSENNTSSNASSGADSNDTSSDATSSDPNRMDMDGWSPWF